MVSDGISPILIWLERHTIWTEVLPKIPGYCSWVGTGIKVLGFRACTAWNRALGVYIESIDRATTGCRWAPLLTDCTDSIVDRFLEAASIFREE
jgi:hypothetical protein